MSQLVAGRRADAALVATRADIELLVRGDASPAWPRVGGNVVGGPVRRLLAGGGALPDGDGQLALEACSHIPATPAD